MKYKKDWLTVTEVADELNVSEVTIRTAIRKGKLHAFKDEKTVRISQEQFQDYINRFTV